MDIKGEEMKLLTPGFLLSALILICSTILTLILRESRIFIFSVVFALIIYGIQIVVDDEI
jgi:hypothetical protein